MPLVERLTLAMVIEHLQLFEQVYRLTPRLVVRAPLLPGLACQLGTQGPEHPQHVVGALDELEVWGGEVGEDEGGLLRVEGDVVADLFLVADFL